MAMNLLIRCLHLISGVAVLLMAGESLAGDDLSAYARQQYEAAAKARKADKGSDASALQFARACFDRAEFATNHAERVLLAEQGIAASREVLQRASNSAPARYYLGMNLGQLARTRGIGALKIVDQMEREFKIAREIDPTLDYAGADRTLGLLYRETPAIASIGSRSKAKHHLQKAAEIAPLFPENRLNLAESYLKWGDLSGAWREYKLLEERWEEARAAFQGERWRVSWVDWTARRSDLRSQLEKKGKVIRSPHG